MAKLTKSTATVTLSGAVEKVTLPASYGWVWVKNMSEGDIFAGLSADISEGADGIMSIPAGDAGRIQTDGQDSVYLLGSGNALVVAQNYADCPFKLGAKGGGADVDGESSYTLKNAVDYPLLGLNMYGKSVQDGTPTPDNPVEIVSVGDGGSVAVQACGKNLFDYSLLPNTEYNGVSFKNNNDGTYTISGAKNDVSKSFLARSELSHEESIKMFSPGTYTLSGIPKEWGWGAHLVVNVFYNGQAHNSLMNTVNRPVLTITKDMITDDFAVSIGVYSSANTQIIAGTFYLQLEKGSTATAFEPYKGTTANITSALPLCGIPVAEGGNYTDSSGQQWVCDELIYNADGTGKIIKHTAKIGSYNGETITTPYISSTGSLTTGATVVYALDTPQEIGLTAAEMSALRQLQTYNGITNISNDGGADISVKYCTNKTLSEYVMPITTGLQKQIDELKSAVLSLGGNI